MLRGKEKYHSSQKWVFNPSSFPGRGRLHSFRYYTTWALIEKLHFCMIGLTQNDETLKYYLIWYNVYV